MFSRLIYQKQLIFLILLVILQLHRCSLVALIVLFGGFLHRAQLTEKYAVLTLFRPEKFQEVLLRCCCGRILEEERLCGWFRRFEAIALFCQLHHKKTSYQGLQGNYIENLISHFPSLIRRIMTIAWR
ncbi:hypothetical protein KSP40_PGU002940 [Platanthera guangdongensis]|uniref:Secreted protein n=1 Tax=Platanthera guangdongensis TaxID=2320717 RepID=A0ABR2LPS2_9ASPA